MSSIGDNDEVSLGDLHVFWNNHGEGEHSFALFLRVPSS